MKEQLLRAKQSLEAEPVAAATTSDADGAATEQAPASGGASAGRAQQRAKKADDYHGRHKDWVAQFNELTGGECAGGESGVKWAAVRAWQQRHWQLNNLLADGLVGPKTIEAAKLLAKKSAPKAAGDDKQGADEKEHAAAEPGQADGAEASADKPKLDEEDADEQIAPETSAHAKGAVHNHKATIAEFERAATKLKELLAQFKPPAAGPGEKPIAQHYVEGTDDTEAPPALGAMMKTEVLQGYEAAAEGLKSAWGDRSPAARAKFLLDAVNDALAAERVPAIHRVQLRKMPNPGEFIAKDWIMHMNEMIFAASAPPQMSEVASKVFHEGRHAEQRFTIARLMASEQPHASAMKIAKSSGVPPDVASKACELRSQPLSPEQADKAQAFERATVDNPAHKYIEETSAAITDAANHAASVFRGLNPEDQTQVSASWQELRQQTIAGLEAYYHLATERDAFAAQKQLADAIK